jgi:hypothetical protein
VGVSPQTRLYRSFILDELGHDYVRTARAKGLTEKTVLFKHVLRNAMIPILTNIGLALPGVFVGSFLIEVFFSIPGLGREVLLAVNRSDYPVIQAVTVTWRSCGGDQPADRPDVQGRPAVVLANAVVQPEGTAAPRAVQRPGARHAAWRRFKADRVGMVSLIIVLAFLLLMLAALGLGRGWQNEVGVPNARPTIMGAVPEAIGTIEVPRAQVDLGRRPAGAAPRRVGAACRSSRPPRRQGRRCSRRRSPAATTAKAIRARRSRCSSVCWRRWWPPSARYRSFAVSWRIGGSQWLYNVFESIPGIC